MQLKPFSQDYGIAFHTTHVVCINFIYENDRFLRNFFMADLFTLRVFGRNLLRVLSLVEELFFSSYFVVMPNLRYEPGLYV